MAGTNGSRRAAKWPLRIFAGVYLGATISILLDGDVSYWTWRSLWLGAILVLLLVAWYEYKDRDRFEDDFFGGDDDPRGPHGFA